MRELVRVTFLGILLLVLSTACGATDSLIEDDDYDAGEVDGDGTDGAIEDDGYDEGDNYDEGDGDDFQAVLDQYVSPDDPGVVLLIATPDETYIAAQGMADIEAGTPVQTDGLFRIGSSTKTWVAAATLLMADDGLLALDDPISKYISADVLNNIPYSDEITVRQLLNMTAGTFDYLGGDPFWAAIEADPGHLWTASEVLEYAYGEEAEFAPGEDWAYSNTNYVLLQLVIEEASGQDLAAILRQRIIEPLGLTQTYLDHFDSVSGQTVHSYRGGGGWEDVSHINDGQGLADGGLVSNAEEIAVFIRALVTGELLRPDLMSEMEDFVTTPDGPYGLGYTEMETDYGTAYGHNGATSGFVCEMWYLPDEDAAYVMLLGSEDLEVDGLADAGMAWAFED